MQACNKCGSDFVDFASDDNLTCFNCGHIIEESSHLHSEVDLVTTSAGTRACGSLVSITSDGTSASTSVPRNGGGRHLHSNSLDSVQKQISAICAKLSVGEMITSQVQFLHKTIDHTVKYSRSPDLLAASLVCIVLRQNQMPYTLLDMSQVVRKNVFAIGRVFVHVLHQNGIVLNELDPTVFVTRACNHIRGLPPTEMDLLRKNALQIINTLQPHWVYEGKRQDAVCVAAIYIAAEASGISADLKNMNSELKIGDSTSKSRVREIKAQLLKVATQKLPWVKEVTVKSLTKNLNKIMKHLEMVTRLCDSQGITQTESLKRSNGPAPSTLSPEVGAPCSPLNTPAKNLNTTPSTIPSTSTTTPLSPVKPSLSPQTFSNSAQPNRSPTENAIPSYPIDDKDLVDKKIDTIQDMDLALSKNPLPAAFVSSMDARRKRRIKLDNAKRRLFDNLLACPDLAKDMSPSLLDSIYSLAAVPIKTHGNLHELITAKSAPPFASPPKIELKCANPNIHVKRRASPPAKSEVQLQVDQEDLIIERMLLNDVSEAQILDGFYFITKAPNTHSDSSSETLGEEDIPDKEMDKFIRTPSEVLILSRFMEPQEEEKQKEKQEEVKEKGKKTRGKAKKPAGQKRGRRGKAKEKEEKDEEVEVEEKEIEEEEEEEDAESAGEELVDSRKRARGGTV